MCNAGTSLIERPAFFGDELINCFVSFDFPTGIIYAEAVSRFAVNGTNIGCFVECEREGKAVGRIFVDNFNFVGAEYVAFQLEGYSTACAGRRVTFSRNVSRRIAALQAADKRKVTSGIRIFSSIVYGVLFGIERPAFFGVVVVGCRSCAVLPSIVQSFKAKLS